MHYYAFVNKKRTFIDYDFIFINFGIAEKSNNCLFKALLSDFNDKKTIHSFE